MITMSFGTFVAIIGVTAIAGKVLGKKAFERTYRWCKETKRKIDKEYDDE